MSTGQPSAGRKDSQRVKIIFSALLLTMLMSSLGQMIFSTALPTIVGDLGGVEKMSWVISIFLTFQTIAMPLFGKLGDVWGRKWLYVFAIGLFVFGSALGGFAHTMDLLIVGRGIQGFAAGGLMISSQSIVAEVIPARQRGKFMGVMGAVFGVSSVLGPVLGGWFTDGPGWRWGLWVNIPLGLLALVVAAVVLRLRVGERSMANFDWLGAVFISTFTSSLILMTTWAGTKYEWGSAVIIGLSISTVLSALALGFVELRAAQPLIPLSLFKNRNMLLTTASGTVMGLAMFGVLGYMPTYLQMVHTLSPTQAGLMMITMMAGLILTSTSVGFVISRFGRYKPYPIIGLAIMSTGLFVLSRLEASTPLAQLGVYLFIFGVGLGLVMQVLVLIVQNSFPIALVGTATAANNFFRQIGGAVGASLVGSLFIHNLQNEMTTRLPAALEALGEEGKGLGEKFTNTGGLSSLTPESVAQLPAPLHDAIVNSYNDGLTPVFLLMVPLAITSLLILLPVKEDALKETVE